MKLIGCSVARLCAIARAKFKIILNEKFRRNRHFIDENRSGDLLIRIRALARAQINQLITVSQTKSLYTLVFVNVIVGGSLDIGLEFTSEKP